MRLGLLQLWSLTRQYPGVLIGKTDVVMTVSSNKAEAFTATAISTIARGVTPPTVSTGKLGWLIAKQTLTFAYW